MEFILIGLQDGSDSNVVCLAVILLGKRFLVYTTCELIQIQSKDQLLVFRFMHFFIL